MIVTYLNNEPFRFYFAICHWVDRANWYFIYNLDLLVRFFGYIFHNTELVSQWETDQDSHPTLLENYMFRMFSGSNCPGEHDTFWNINSFYCERKRNLERLGDFPINTWGQNILNGIIYNLVLLESSTQIQRKFWVESQWIK